MWPATCQKVLWQNKTANLLLRKLPGKIQFRYMTTTSIKKDPGPPNPVRGRHTRGDTNQSHPLTNNPNASTLYQRMHTTLFWTCSYRLKIESYLKVFPIRKVERKMPGHPEPSSEWASLRNRDGPMNVRASCYFCLDYFHYRNYFPNDGHPIPRGQTFIADFYTIRATGRNTMQIVTKWE